MTYIYIYDIYDICPDHRKATETLAQQLTDPSDAVRVQAAEAMASERLRKW